MDALAQKIEALAGRADAGDEMTAPLVVYVDIDDTLVRSSGKKRIPMTAMVEHVRALHRGGALLYGWSTAGADYARTTARELDLEVCFTDYAESMIMRS